MKTALMHLALLAILALHAHVIPELYTQTSQDQAYTKRFLQTHHHMEKRFSDRTNSFS